MNTRSQSRVARGEPARMRKHNEDGSLFFTEGVQHDDLYSDEEGGDPETDGAFKQIPLTADMVHMEGGLHPDSLGPEAPNNPVILSPDGTMQKPKRQRKSKKSLVPPPQLLSQVDPETGLVQVITEMENPNRKGTRARLQRWTLDEDEILLKLVPNTKITQENPYFWRNIAKAIPGKTINQCFQHWNRVLNPEIKKGPWTPDEEEELVNIVNSLKSDPRHLWSRVASKTRGRIDTQCRYQMKLIENSAAHEWEAPEEDILIFVVRKEMEKNDGVPLNWIEIAHTFNTRVCRMNSRNTPIRAAMHIKQRYQILVEQNRLSVGPQQFPPRAQIESPQQRQTRPYPQPIQQSPRQRGGDQYRNQQMRGNLQSYETLNTEEYVYSDMGMPMPFSTDGGHSQNSGQQEGTMLEGLMPEEEVQEEEMAAGLLEQLDEQQQQHHLQEQNELASQGHSQEGVVKVNHSEEAEGLLSLQENQEGTEGNEEHYEEMQQGEIGEEEGKYEVSTDEVPSDNI